MTYSFTALPHDASGSAAIGRRPMSSIQRTPHIELNGEWDFHLLADAADKLPDRWGRIQVPGLWTMTEPADPPQYLNVAMPFDESPPTVPERNPVGVYRRTFTVDVRDAGRLILHVGAAEGYLRVFVNEQLLGTSHDSHLAAEFDITEAVAPGDNELLLAITKWSAETYLEDQDHWWQSGITRPVSLCWLPTTHVTDMKAVADFDPVTGRGALSVIAFIDGLPAPTSPTHTVRLRALGVTQSQPIAPLTLSPSLNTTSTRPTIDRSTPPASLVPPDSMDLFSEVPAGVPARPGWEEAAEGIRENFMNRKAQPGTATFDLVGLQVQPWSAEVPHLETVVLELLTPDGEVADTITLRVGFRRVVVVGRDLLVNGRRIMVQGVNRHDVHPRTGRVLTEQDMRDELGLLKRFNVNAIRTSHYPNDPVFLDLCDEFGFYVVDEADIEGHAFMDQVSEDPIYLPAFTERVSRMVLRDRNHPCIIAWSLGNETGYGANHDGVAAWVRRFEPTRPVLYEGAVSRDWHGGHAATDIACPMYPSFYSLEAYAHDPRTDRPVILTEYAYSQGNSTGGLARYWELFETLPGLQGGFIWEFLDHALDPDGDGRYRSGADFGDAPNDGDLMLNGIVFADRTPKPALYEARGLFAPVRIVSTESDVPGELRVLNRQTFADLSRFRFALRVEKRWAETVEVPIEISAGAGETVTVTVPDLAQSELAAGEALAVTLVVSLLEETPWAAAGTVIAEQQVKLSPTLPEVNTAPSHPLQLDQRGEVSHPLLAQPPRLSLWRAQTDNDKSIFLDNRFVRSGFFQLDVEDRQIRDDGATRATVTIRYRTAYGDQVIHQREITSPGANRWVFHEHVTLPEGTSDGLRVGMELHLVDGFDAASWVGLGPWENYPDRRTSALLGTWSSSIDDLQVPYLPPQENGGRGLTTELRLTGARGIVRSTHGTPLQVNVSRHTPGDLESTPHWWQVPASTATVVQLDVAHRGLGTGVLGPDTSSANRLTERHYDWCWELDLGTDS